MEKASRIVWTRDERDRVYKHMEDVFVESPHITRQEALARGQMVLPIARRFVIQPHRVHTHKPLIEAARLRAKTRAMKASSEPPEAGVAMSVPTEVSKPQEGASDRLVGAVTALVEAIESRVESRLAARLEEILARMHPGEYHPKHDPSMISVEAPAKPGVLIIGLLASQSNLIRVVYKDRLDLTFLGSEEAVAREPIRRAHTILMTKFISHAVQEKYRKAPDLRYCNGGGERLMVILDDLLH